MIQSFKARAPRKVRGTDIKEGDTLYAIRRGNLYFIWSYLHREMAEWINARLANPADATDRAANWCTSPHHTKPTAVIRRNLKRV